MAATQSMVVVSANVKATDSTATAAEPICTTILTGSTNHSIVNVNVTTPPTNPNDPNDQAGIADDTSSIDNNGIKSKTKTSAENVANNQSETKSVKGAIEANGGQVLGILSTDQMPVETDKFESVRSKGKITSFMKLLTTDEYGMNKQMLSNERKLSLKKRSERQKAVQVRKVNGKIPKMIFQRSFRNKLTCKLVL